MDDTKFRTETVATSLVVVMQGMEAQRTADRRRADDVYARRRQDGERIRAAGAIDTASVFARHRVQAGSKALTRLDMTTGEPLTGDPRNG